jgi:hypothetical protein
MLAIAILAPLQFPWLSAPRQAEAYVEYRDRVLA